MLFVFAKMFFWRTNDDGWKLGDDKERDDGECHHGGEDLKIGDEAGSFQHLIYTTMSPLLFIFSLKVF